MAVFPPALWLGLFLRRNAFQAELFPVAAHPLVRLAGGSGEGVHDHPPIEQSKDVFGRVLEDGAGVRERVSPDD